MPIVVSCSCGKKYQVGDDKAGMKMRCKACQNVIAVPKPQTPPADELDDFGDDFGGMDDFGDLADQGEPIAPKPKSTGKKSGAKSKGKAKNKKKSGGKKKSSKGKSEMPPAVKYGLSAFIFVATAGIVIGILYANGTIGGGKKDGGSSVASGDDPANTGMPEGAAPGGHDAGGPAGGHGASPGGGQKAQIDRTDGKSVGKTDNKSNGSAIGKTDGSQQNSVPTFTVAGLTAKSAAGDTSMANKRIRVRGTVTSYLAQYKQVMFDSGGGRVVLFHFPNGLSNPINPGDVVVLEGSFSRSERRAIFLGNAAIISQKSGSSGGGIAVTAEKLTGDYQGDATAANAKYRNKKITVTGSIATIDGTGASSLMLRGVDGTAVLCMFPLSTEKQRKSFLSVYYLQTVTLEGQLVSSEKKNTLLTLSRCIFRSAEPYKRPPMLPDDYVVITKQHVDGIATKKLRLDDALRWKDSPYYAHRIVVQGAVKKVTITDPRSTIDPQVATLELVAPELKANYRCGLYSEEFARALKVGQKVQLVGRFVTAFAGANGVELSVQNCAPLDPLPGVPTPKGTTPDRKTPNSGGNEKLATVAIQSAADLIKQNPPGNASQKGKTIRVKGAVAKPWNQGWIFLTGDGRRNVACKFAAAPAQQPTVGQTIVVEGTFFDSAASYISLANAKLVQETAADGGNGKGGKHAAGEIAAVDLLKQNPPGSTTLKNKTVRVKGALLQQADRNGWLYLKGDGQRTVACQFQPVPQQQPAVGQAVVIEGTFYQSVQRFITVVKCRVVAKAESPGGKSSPGKRPVVDSKFPIVLSNAKVRFVRNNWLIQVDYRFTNGPPAANDWYFFSVTVPGNQPNYQPMQGNTLKQQGTLRLRAEAAKGQPASGELAITVFYGKSRNQSTGRPVAETLKVKVGESSPKRDDT